MQFDIAAINGVFPEGVWLEALFGFLLQRRYLTVVFQDGDAFLSKKAHLDGACSSVTATQVHL